MLSRQPSRNSTRFPNLGQRRSWESSWKLDFRSSFDLGRYRPGPPLPSSEWDRQTQDDPAQSSPAAVGNQLADFQAKTQRVLRE